ncbi:MAG: MurR/RpiR family transcriptional regulator [Desulfuromonadales bacterium]|nr:MurR/RpiR family transcriptional regulator [Desulfuromonadales bacterium]
MDSVLSTIRSLINSLKKAERQVGEYVLREPFTVIESTITEVAKKAKVSEPTVIRFCRKAGLKGYMDLRLSLARDLPKPVQNYKTVDFNDSPVKILEKTLTCHQDVLSTVLNSIDVMQFTKAVDLVSAAKQIDIYGFGGSGLIAMEAWHKFFRVGIPCNTYKDAHLHLIGASMLNPECVVLALSIHGASIDLINAVNVAKEAGAKIIGITGTKGSPLGKLCDVTLPLDCQEPAPWLYRLSTRLAQMAVLDALFVAVATQLNEKGGGKFIEIPDSISVKNI